MQGKIIKGIAGFYYVHVENQGIYECKAKGIFRNKKIKPLVGDDADIEVIDKDNFIGNIVNILPRKNELIRPAAANIDQAMIIFAMTNPAPNFNLMDRFLIMMEQQNVPTIICFNKMDEAEKTDIEEFRKMYENSGSSVIFISARENIGMDELRKILEGKTTILAGPSGVGKSTVTNLLLPEANMETGGVSKIGRGRHTTRHSEIFNVSGNTYICDTPGFTSLNLPQLEKEDVRFYYNEFSQYEGQCRFNGCVHINEPNCAVKTAIEEGKIPVVRYENYKEIYDEISRIKKY